MLRSNLIHKSPATRLDIHHDEVLLELIRIINASGITYQAIADMAGVSNQTVERWCAKEVHSPRLQTMARVLSVLGYTLMILPVSGKSEIRWN
jgi:DNA-binding phage protein